MMMMMMMMVTLFCCTVCLLSLSDSVESVRAVDVQGVFFHTSMKDEFQLFITFSVLNFFKPDVFFKDSKKRES